METLFQNITLEQAIKLVKPPSRKDIVKEFVTRLNEEITANNKLEMYKEKPMLRKEWKPAYIAFRLSHIKDKHDLYFLLSNCKDSKCFGKHFWWSIKTCTNK